MNVYLDNAATTPMDSRVIEAMHDVMKNCFGNPSSVHAHGRQAKAHLERSRKLIANQFNVPPSSIFFTSGGTEADNTAIRQTVEMFSVKHIISSKLEHHAVLHTIEELAEKGIVTLSFVRHNHLGQLDISHLETLLSENNHALVTLMHANNEIGSRISLDEVGQLCQKYNAIFHSDTVQTIGHYRIDLSTTPVDMIVCSAHKLHGPKGVGFLYLKPGLTLHPLITGGAQEKNLRAGTENLYGIVGLAKAIEMAYSDIDAHEMQIRGLRDYMKNRLMAVIPDISFNGGSNANDLYTILNVSFPPLIERDMFLLKLDILGISASAGSACSSGSNVISHVLKAIDADPQRPAIRFSFSRFNTKEDVDNAVAVLAKLYQPNTVS